MNGLTNGKIDVAKKKLFFYFYPWHSAYKRRQTTRQSTKFKKKTENERTTERESKEERDSY